jgi:hypothetical protein
VITGIGQRSTFGVKQKLFIMKNVVLKYGSIAGLIQVVVGFGLMALLIGDGRDKIQYGELLGYTTMIVALSVIFFGVRTYRDEHLDGTITFGKALKTGIYITLIASAFYIVGWLLYYHLGSGKEMMDAYLDSQIAAIQNSGQSAEGIQQEIDRMNGFMEMYKNPVVMIGMTFMEIFPVGLIISLISAALLRRSSAVMA